jgi:hypothetical protein
MASCGDSSITAPIVTPEVDAPTAPAITGVAASSIETAAATILWFTDRPATGFVAYGTTMSLGNASTLETVRGTTHAVTLTGLEASTTYQYRVSAEDSLGIEATSTYRTFTTDPEVPTDPQAPSASLGIWIGSEELAKLAMSGAAWTNVLAEANRSCGAVDLSDQEQTTNVCIMAKALVFARTGDTVYRADVMTALRQITTAPSYVGRALALARELGAYVIAADLIGLPTHDPTLDAAFRATLRTLRTTYTEGAASSLIDSHESRPNNWGAHAGATRAAIAVYLGDTVDLDRTAQVFKGYLGDRSAYAGFDYGGPDNDLSWQCDPTQPVGINPIGCSRDGLSLDGVLPDDQRRGGAFTTTPPKEPYVWEALQGLVAQAVILNRAGYPVWDWEDRALLRALRWAYDVVDYPAEGDDTWQPYVVNYYYGTNFAAPSPSRAGKNVGWTDWTHQ